MTLPLWWRDNPSHARAPRYDAWTATACKTKCTVCVTDVYRVDICGPHFVQCTRLGLYNCIYSTIIAQSDAIAALFVDRQPGEASIGDESHDNITRNVAPLSTNETMSSTFSYLFIASSITSQYVGVFAGIGAKWRGRQWIIGANWQECAPADVSVCLHDELRWPGNHENSKHLQPCNSATTFKMPCCHVQQVPSHSGYFNQP